MSGKFQLTSLLLLCAAMHRVTSHSWIACTDYLEMNGDYWDADACRAFPRHGHQYTPKDNFGVDRGYNIINPPENAPCRTERNDGAAYTDDYPMAVYFPGQTVVLAHPTKNHVADTGCTNKYIPDNGNVVWLGPRDGQSDVTLSQFQANEIADFGVSPHGHNVADAVTRTYPKIGFQNAPKFCENTDKALATNEFVVPNLETGTYTMMWGWYFNSPQDLYTSCWEVEIVANRAARDEILENRGQTTNDPTGTGGDTPAPAPTPAPGPSPAPGPASSPAPGPASSPAPDQCVCECPETKSNGVERNGARYDVAVGLVCVVGVIRRWFMALP